ncbi:hypothetical protein AYO38_07290 [bacterium SCGC AG-212-C10]|nr:hypothetical protein AYO38_07290 [bacterium SCGC AG-212-C10]
MAHVPRVYVPGRIARGRLSIAGDSARHLQSVLRVRHGDPLLLFSGDGREWSASVLETTRQAVVVTVGEQTRMEAAAPLMLEVWIALVRAQRLDWAIEKVTEAGADIIRPLVTHHASRGDTAGQSRQDRWQRIAVEAAEQSGRLFLPVIEAPIAFDAALARPGVALYIADGAGIPWSEAARLLPARGAVALAVGPEGGFSDDEIARAKSRGAVAVSLGPNVLRTETAALAGVALFRGALPNRT